MKNQIFIKLHILLILGYISIALYSCNFMESGLPRSSGSINELLIVTDSPSQWEDEIGDSISAFFARDQVGLPQPEPVFDITNISAANLGAVSRKLHNIFIAEINPKIISVSFTVKKNVWSDPQRIIKIAAPDEKSFLSEFDLRKDTITKVYDQLERQRTLLLDGKSFEINAAEAIRNRFLINLSVPGGFYIAKETPDFMWLRHKFTKPTQDTELGIFIYSSENSDTNVFNPKHIITWRNMIIWQNMITPTGNPMKVSEEYITPVFNVIPDFPAGYAIETRGLWEIHNDFMGGSFVSYTFRHPETNKVITLDGYVYNPNNDKKDFIRRLESIFWAVRY
jgi:hypothetical protein